MTHEQATYLNLLFVKEHMSLVIDSNQFFQPSHDVASQVIKIYETVFEKPVDQCQGCVREAYIALLEKLNEEKPKKPKNK